MNFRHILLILMMLSLLFCTGCTKADTELPAAETAEAADIPAEPVEESTPAEVPAEDIEPDTAPSREDDDDGPSFDPDGDGFGPDDDDDDGPSGDFGGRGGGFGGGAQEAAYPEAVALFTQHEYTDSESGLTVPYNLYLPEGYNENETYPLMIFVADSSVNSDEVTDPLAQDGAAVWATAEEQAKHPCIVLVPQYTTSLVNEIGMLTTDTHEWNQGLTLMKSLFDYILETYSVDESRIYGTGQSQGGMMTIAISDKYPDFYTAQYLVACQWDAQEMAAMADDKLWITVCEGDFKAYPGMNASVAVWEGMGIPVIKNDTMWDSAASPEELDALVEDMAAREGSIHYTVFAEGNHMGTWKFAYDIEAIRDWLFAQTK